jgi:23S rRNA (uracil-5-)-methyltransferase RumA
MNTLCPNKEVCGSCSWSHIPYEKQVQQKLSDINGSFALKGLKHKVREILASPVTEHYRNRMDFVIDFEGRVGMRMKGKWWKVIDGHTCFLADEKIEKLFHQIRNWSKKAGISYFDRKAHTGILRYAVIRATKKGETMVNIITSGVEGEEAEQVKKALQELNELTNPTTLIWSQNHTITDVSFGDEMQTIAGPGVIGEVIGGNTYIISPNAFFQTNSHAAELLLGTVQEFAGDLSDKTLLDLYCGSGFFSIAMSSETKKTIGIELNEEAIKDAVKNAQANSSDVEYIGAKTEAYDWSVHNADVVILDPPRAGMHDTALADVMKHQPETIVYVSCNYKNFARELVKLQEIYDVTAMRAIDMFPHTPHVELVAKLEKKK